MRVTPITSAILGSLLLVACGDGGSSPGSGNDLTATRFDQLADSIASGGDYAHADALRHAAMIVRLTGDPTPVTLTIAGDARGFVAVAEELEYPMMTCTWPADSGVVFPDSGRTPRDSTSVPPAPAPTPGTCTTVGTSRMRTLIAWEPTHMTEVVRLVADEGRGSVEPAVPDAMAGPNHESSWGGMGRPATPTLPPPGDSVIGSPPVGPGFMGEYLERDRGFWISVSGTQSNAVERDGGACRQQEVDFDWARYSCQALGVRFEFSMTVQKLVPIPFGGFSPRDSVPPTPAETRQISMPATSVAGARLSLLQWLPPPPGPVGPPVPAPMPMPVPSDSGMASPGMPTRP